MQRNYLILVVFLLSLMTTGCRSVQPSAALHVSAAASLTEAAQEMVDTFKKNHPDVQVYLNTAGSQVLRRQIEMGADTDVFLSADQVHIEALVEQNLMEKARLFALNDMVVAVFPGSKRGYKKLADLGAEGVSLAAGTAEVPAGRYMRQIIDKLPEVQREAILHNIVTYEFNVRSVLAKVEAGEVDAGFVYGTDAAGSSKVKVLEIPPSQNIAASYYLAMKAGRENKAAQQFVELVFSDKGRRLLSRYGFQLPEDKE